MSDPTPAPATKKRRPAPRKRKPAAEKPKPDKAAASAPAADAAPTVVAEPLIRVPLTVRWRDLDAFNHVNNSKYLSYLEEARLRWMITMPGMGLEDHIAPVVAASNLNYRRPIGWPGEIMVELFVERLGNTSVTLGHRIVDAGDSGALYCDGNVVMVWIDREDGRAAPLPDFVRSACKLDD
ncbi:acyl-CoA thioesterase [Lysobacter korlensis]|uniref:Acyl-CoA thioesterase n=1 Tax=Lysobacter korlensis TaxID=553636 RepID=A0ABV6RQ09_9GAMM